MTADDRPMPPKVAPKGRAVTRLRNWFFAGVVVGAPIGITIWLVWSFVSFVDGQIKPLIPQSWNPDNYLPFALPGLGIAFVVIALILLGLFATNLIGRSLLRLGDRIVARVPVVRSIYSVLKQVFETFASTDGGSFKEAVMIEYPRKGTWAIGFVTSRSPDPEILAIVPNAIAVFVPTSPNPATGFMVFVSPDDVRRLDMSVDRAAKLVISIGIAGKEPVPPLTNVTSPG